MAWSWPSVALAHQLRTHVEKMHRIHHIRRNEKRNGDEGETEDGGTKEKTHRRLTLTFENNLWNAYMLQHPIRQRDNIVWHQWNCIHNSSNWCCHCAETICVRATIFWKGTRAHRPPAPSVCVVGLPARVCRCLIHFFSVEIWLFTYLLKNSRLGSCVGRYFHPKTNVFSSRKIQTNEEVKNDEIDVTLWHLSTSLAAIESLFCLLIRSMFVSSFRSDLRKSY